MASEKFEMKIFFAFLSVFSVVLVAGIANGDEFFGPQGNDFFVIEVNQPIGPDPEAIGGTWIFPTNPLGDLLFIYAVEIDIQHSRAADLVFSMGSENASIDFVNMQGGEASLDGAYTFVPEGGAPAGTWGDGPGVYNANDWFEGTVEYRDIIWSWGVADTAIGNQGFVGTITIEYDAGIIPEPSSAALLGVCLIGAWMRRRRS